MSEALPADETELLTVDELSRAVGLSVRTTRYYASLGLMPAPLRRGRLAFYGPAHRARLELVRALQDHGFTLQAIDRLVAAIPARATPEEIALQRAMLTSWTGARPERVGREELSRRAARELTERDLRVLVIVAGIEAHEDDEWSLLPGFERALGILDVQISEEALEQAGAAISHRMGALADDLTAVLHRTVLDPYRSSGTTPEEARKLESTLPVLRRFVLEGVVIGFQRAANEVIARALWEGLAAERSVT